MEEDQVMKFKPVRHMQIHGAWWDAAMSAEGASWCHCEATVLFFKGILNFKSVLWFWETWTCWVTWAKEKTREVQQKDIKSPAPGEEQPHPSVSMGSQLAEKQLWRRPEGPGEQGLKHEPTVCPHGREAKQHPGMHEREQCRQFKGSDPSPLLSKGKSYLEC